MSCKHHDFEARVEANRLEDSGQFNAEIKIKCTECGTPFRFIGLPYGLDLNGAAVSVSGLEARLAIAPKDEVLNISEEGVQGFTVRRVK